MWPSQLPSGRTISKASKSGPTKRAYFNMALLTVRHYTGYRYSAPVELGEHRMMSRPPQSHDLTILRTSLEIFPRPASLRWLHDVFDNSVAVSTFEGFTSELSF